MSDSRPEDGEARAQPPRQPRADVPRLGRKHPDRILEERAERVRGRFFLVSLFLALIGLAVGLFQDALSGEWRNYAGVIGIFSLTLAGPVFAAALFVGTLFRLQIYITDLIFLTSLASFLLSLVVPPIYDEYKRQGFEVIARALFASTVPLLLFVGGVAWGLSTAKRLDEQRAFRRIGLFVTGWSLLSGVLALVVFPFMFFGVFFEHGSFLELLLVVLLIVLGLPGAYVELYSRRRRYSRPSRPHKGGTEKPPEAAASTPAERKDDSPPRLDA
jgi:hypothetical protein